MLKRYRIIIIALVSIALLLSITACTNNKQKSGVTAETTTAELNDAEMASLMRQVADSDVSRSYGEYLKDEAFADAEVFGIERDGDQGTAYAYLYDGEYVVFKDKAYEMSGSAGEAMIKFVYGEDDVTLSEIIWSADGGEHENWMKENFPAEALRRAKNYKAYDSNGKSILGSKVNETVEGALGVPVETENLLMIDIDNGTYELIKTMDGNDGTFDTETLETGKLKDL
ncbi:MAG: hypothetical protein IJH28_05220 [Mogibacterium sp.]|nr:hypothetical protein [Mogibacterium sp.]